MVEVEIFAGNFVAREDLREARVDARRRAGDEADVGVRRDGHERRVAHAAFHFCAQHVPVESADACCLSDGRVAMPRSASSVLIVSIGTMPLRPAGTFEVRVASAFAREIGALVDRHVADEFEDAVREIPGVLRCRTTCPSCSSTSANPMTPRPIARFSWSSCVASGMGSSLMSMRLSSWRTAKRTLSSSLCPVDLLVVDVRGEVERREVADGDVVLVLRKADLGAEVRHVDRAGVVVEGAELIGIFPGQPRVRGGLKETRIWRYCSRAGTFLNMRILPASAIFDVFGVALR